MNINTHVTYRADSTNEFVNRVAEQKEPLMRNYTYNYGVSNYHLNEDVSKLRNKLVNAKIEQYKQDRDKILNDQYKKIKPDIGPRNIQTKANEPTIIMGDGMRQQGGANISNTTGGIRY